MGIKGKALLGLVAAAVIAYAVYQLAARRTGATSAAPNSVASQQNSEWPLLGGSADQLQFSPLAQINDQNATRLGLAWFADLPVADGLVGTPLVMDGTVYQGAPGGQIVANDVRTGKLLWNFKPAAVDRTNFKFSAIWATHYNRGVAIDRDHAYIASGDCRLFAVDRRTGKQVWESQPCDATKEDLGIVGAPRVGGGMVFIGNTNAESGTARGHVDAFDAATGKHLWRFYTMPGDPAAGFENAAMEMASKTWGKEYWKLPVGSAAPWEGITYDEKLNRVYVGVGNPVPFNPDKRAPGNGDELFTNSIIALDAKTGQYLWHYQTTPHDGWDMDAIPHTMIVNLPIGGSNRRVLMQASKNGFFYVLDAETGKFLSADNYVPNNWASHVDPATGRLVILESGKYWKHPEKTGVSQPGGMGGHSWTLMAYNPASRLVYIPAFIWPNRDDASDSELTQTFAEFKEMGKLVAWDPIAQKERWHVDQTTRVFNGGVLTTAGNLVLQGTGQGTFEAYAADTGKSLWSFDAKGTILAAPITVEVDGEQIILVPSGDAGSTASAQVIPQLVTAPWAQSRPRLLAFKLNGTAVLPPNAPIPDFPKPFLPRQPEKLAGKGAEIFDSKRCGTCHGYSAIKLGAAIPDLRRAKPAAYAAMPAIVIGGAYRQKGMPAFPDLTEADLEALKAFLTNSAWTAYEEQQAKPPN